MEAFWNSNFSIYPSSSNPMETSFDMLTISDLQWNIFHPTTIKKEKNKSWIYCNSSLHNSTEPYHLDNPWQKGRDELESVLH